MSLSVLLLLSLLTVQCGGCDFDQISVENIKATIDSNPTGFRTVFPRDYYVQHHYNRSMLCETNPCCVFPAAVVLQDSWAELLPNLWEEHVNYSLIVELMDTLNTIIKKNGNAQLFQEETDLAQFSTVWSSPEELLNLTSELFTQWLKVACSPSVETCPMPTLPPSVEKKNDRPPRSRLLTTRAVNNAEKRMSVPNASFKGLSLPVYDFSSVWSLLLFRLYWWLLPQ
ncbi:uncharacterized protein LOC110016677 [Oryzias latipes]|uniref:uncharacterized protein LOC110016677 n=1 Tax=Oryzias latipes TaxID=8090 RepID=UPI0009DAADCD|nr:uncharacterized protein LOC110016677 [Oryzias latipes]